MQLETTKKDIEYWPEPPRVHTNDQKLHPLQEHHCKLMNVWDLLPVSKVALAKLNVSFASRRESNNMEKLHKMKTLRPDLFIIIRSMHDDTHPTYDIRNKTQKQD